MAALADELSKITGILEPFQTEKSVNGQVEELRSALEKHAALPATLVGHSCGAWLAFMTASRYPSLVKKLILVCSGTFDAKTAESINTERLNRLSEPDRIEFLKAADIINGVKAGNKDKALASLGALAAKADTYETLPLKAYPAPEGAGVSEEIYRGVWPEAAEMRRSGKLLAMGKNIICPVIAVNGDYDTHLAEGVREPLSRVLKDFKFILLEKCGHTPWAEKYARDRFFEVLREEIS